MSPHSSIIKSGRRMLRITALIMLLFVSAACSSGGSDPVILARVEVPGYLEDLNLPVHADLEDAKGTYYALVIARKSQLDAAGVTYRGIDMYTPGTRYLIGWEENEAAHKEAAGLVNILYDDGEHIIVRYTSDLSELLPDLGFDIRIMSESPINVLSGGIQAMVDEAVIAAAAPFEKNTKIETMLQGVTQDNIKSATEQLSGEKAITLDGVQVSITSRHTYREETKVQQATQYVYNLLKGMGLTVSFQNWTVPYGDESLSNRNVVGEIKGQTLSNEIVILIAHLDSISKVKDGVEPGADDNASGCVGLLTAADMMRSYKFKRTIRFVFTTGEEQSLYGGKAYAQKIHDEKENIVAVLNLDMIGYSKVVKDVKPKQQIKIRNRKNRTGYTKDLPIAQTYVNVVNTYNLDTTKKLSDIFETVIEDDGEAASDHSPFWDLMAKCIERGDATVACYPAAWAIEYAEEGYINPYMHSANDRIGEMNLAYYTALVKAALGTIAHLAEPVD